MFGNIGNAFGNGIIDKMFRKVDNMVWDMTSGSVGILDGNDIITVNLGETKDGKADDAQIIVNPIADFSFPMPAFAQSVKPEDIKIGDMIFTDKKVLGWVVSIKEDPAVKNKFEILKKDGTITRWGPPSVKILGFDTGVLVLRSLFNMLPGGSKDVSSFANSLMPLMMMGGGSDDMEKIIPMMLMTQMGVGGMTTDASGGIMQTMMTMMMMKNLMGGNNSGNTGGGFGGSSGGFFNPPGRR